MKKLAALLLVFAICLGIIPYAAADSPSDDDFGIYGSVNDYPYIEGRENISVLDQNEFTELINEFIEKYQYDGIRFSVAMCYPLTGECAYYNPDEWYISGSLYKLPLCMKIENLALNNDPLAAKIDEKQGIYNVVYNCLVYSNNTYGIGMLQNYISISDLLQIECDLAGWDYTDDLYGKDWKMRYSARFYLDLLIELYNNQEQYPHIIDYMTLASPNLYFKSTELSQNYTIAQKYGSTDEVNHVAGFIFTDNPVILVIMTAYTSNAATSKFAGRLSDMIIDYTENTLDVNYNAQYSALED